MYKTVTTSAEVTPEVIESWKNTTPKGASKGSKTKVLELIGGDFKAWLRGPTRDDMRELSAKGATVDRITYTEIIMEALWLGGDEEIRTDDALFYGVMDVVQDIIDVAAVSLKKL